MAGAIFAMDASNGYYIATIPAIGCSILALIVMIIFNCQIEGIEVKHEKMKDLAAKIHKGAVDFLKTEYQILAGFVIFIMIMVAVMLIGSLNSANQKSDIFGVLTAIPLFFGASLSAFAGWRGMKIATIANVRTTQACDPASGGSINEGLKVAFKSGAVMGLGVTGFGLLGLSVTYLVYVAANATQADAWQYMSGFGFGASCIALFARVGGGVYTKAADVGADLVGKVEAGIPEDHPNNAAVIADNVGDNVGDVAGMGADLFESFVGSIIATCALATTQFAGSEEMTASAIALPFWVAGTGMLCSIVGMFFVKTNAVLPDLEGASIDEKREKNNEVLTKLLHSIDHAILLAGVLGLGASCGCCFALFEDKLIAGKIFSCIAIGLVAGILIGWFTEYTTSYTRLPTQNITKSGKTGPATVVIQGLGVGMIGTVVPTVLIVAAICSCNSLMGLYGIAVAAVGMLSTLGITLATDAYGPVADNAGGIAEMTEDLSEAVRNNTDALDAMGNTTAATGKGFAIGSAVLTSVGLIAAYMKACGLSVVSINEPLVLSGVLIGATLPFVFAAVTMLSVGKSAEAIIFVVRDEFQKYPDLKTHLNNAEAEEEGFTGPPLYKADQDPKVDGAHHGKCKKGDVIVPDYERCIAIATTAAIKEMIIPGAIAVVMPLVIGFILSAKGLAGMLIGSLSSGCMLAIAMSNAGGAWDNAKKYAKQLGLNKTEKEHFDATVVGDTVGDPFKDTSGPALNILIKLMSVISLVIAPTLKNWQLDTSTGLIQEWEPRSVGVGVAILVVLIIVCYIIQKKIDYAYGVKREEVEKSIAAIKERDTNAREAALNANPAAFDALKKLNADETHIPLDVAEKLVAALKNPVAAPPKPKKPVVEVMEVEVATAS